jgi:hypothetical protein
MTEDVTFLQSNNFSMIKVEIRATNGGTGNLQDYIVGLRNIRDGSINEADVLGTKPCQSFHGRLPGARLVFGVHLSRDCTHSLQTPPALTTQK